MTTSEINPHRVAIYIRWSTDDQGEGTTLETQLERCKLYLGSQGWTYHESLVYIDDGCSGGTLERPALTKLRADVESGRVECVVVYKIDRLSRSVVDIVDLVLREWEGRCFVKSTTEEVNTISPAGKMFFYILVSFAEYERNVIRERTMGGKVKRAEQGLNPGFRPPYGYVKGAEPGTLVVVEHEAGVVRRIFELYLKGNGAGKITELLNAEGVYRRGKRWNQLMIRRLICNPAYSGVLEYGRTMRTSKEQRTRQNLGSVIRFRTPRFARVEGAFPAIVDPESWERAQSLRQARSEMRAAGESRPSYSDYFLSGLAVCQCGASMAGKSVGGRRYYLCSGRKRHGRSACDAGHIPTGVIHTEVGLRVKAYLFAEGGQACIAGLEKELSERMHEVETALRQEHLLLTAIGERRGRLESDYRSGALPARLFVRELKQAEGDECEARLRCTRLDRRRRQLAQVREDRQALAERIGQIDTWEDLTLPERKQLLRMITAAVRLYRPAHGAGPTTLEIEWIHLGESTGAASVQTAP